jgi:hypothetical protein
MAAGFACDLEIGEDFWRKFVTRFAKSRYMFVGVFDEI